MLTKQKNNTGQLKLDIFFKGPLKRESSKRSEVQIDSKKILTPSIGDYDSNTINDIPSEHVNSSPVITSDDYAPFDFDSQPGDVPTDSSSEFFDPSIIISNSSKPIREPITHHDLSTNRFEPKPVLTPDWREPSESLSSNHPHAKFNASIADTHYQLEILEHRIQMGEDPKRDHPAMSLEALEHEGLQNVTKREKERHERYALVQEKHFLPQFWEQRPYDAFYTKLSAEDSAALRGMIIASTSNNASPCAMKTRKRTWNPHEIRVEGGGKKLEAPTVRETFAVRKEAVKEKHVVESVKEKRKRVMNKSQTVVRLSSKLFDTDLSDDTDFSDF